MDWMDSNSNSDSADSDWWDEGQPPSEVGSCKADLVPVEILAEIFLLLRPRAQRKRDLMLVCRRWHAIMLSTPGINYHLTIRRATQKEAVQAFIQGRKSRLDVSVDVNDEKDGIGFNPENFHACFMAAAQAASRWLSINLISPPPHGEYTNLRILQPLVHLKSFKLACGFGKFIELLMTAISRGASPNLTRMELADPVAVHYLVQPACLHVNNSLTTLSIHLSKRMGSPMDILPYLHRLVTFKVRNLCLPFYPPDASLPLTYTLRSLKLKSASVQWMAGQVFRALEECEIIFPHHADMIEALQPVTMPSCSRFLYHSNDLHSLAQFHLPQLERLDIKSGQWNVWRGNPQLVAICPVVAAGAKSLTVLHLDIECSEQLLLYMLSLIPALEFLKLGVARPNALSKSFFEAFIIREPNADGASDMVGLPSQAIVLLCPSLVSLALHYRRWLRGPDKKAVIIALGDIMKSRNSKNLFRLALSVDEANTTSWSVGKPARKYWGIALANVALGISVPRGRVYMTGPMAPKGLLLLPLKEAEYLRLCDVRSCEFFFTHDHMELMVYDYDRLPQPASLRRALPLFYSLRVLVMVNTSPSFLAGHTFHKLERCRVAISPYSDLASPSLLTETEMPVCTRADIDDPYLLATFKLPQIHQLALRFSHPDCSVIWEKHIAVNANLSGLNLLHLKNWPSDGDLIPILRTLCLLETLIICSWLDVISFRAFLPMDANGTSVLKQTSGGGQTLALLCPRLKSLQIEGQDPSVEPELMPILKDIVTLRAECGFPLKDFTFFEFRLKHGGRFELIGRNGSFTMEKVVLPREAEKFTLDI